MIERWVRVCLVAVVVTLCLGVNGVPAYDWKSLHEQADKLDSQQAFSRATSNNDSRESLYVLALVYLNEHKDREALQVFERLTDVAADVPEFTWGLAEVLRRQHKTRQSEDILNEVLRNRPAFGPAYISLAYIKYIQLEFDRSVNLAQKVVGFGLDKVDLSNYARAYCLIAGGKGMIAHYGGPISKVINGTAVMPNLKKAESLQPNSPAVLFGLGSFYLLAPRLAGGDPEKALTYLERAVRVDPMFADAYVRLAQAYGTKGDKTKYDAYMTKATSIDAESYLALDAASGRCRFICANLQD